ncbi:MAG: 3-deoxy-manno-octulosonate cytidylyltransferase [Bryobacterales bacterium]|nr:3-deoxy-manno-octulosonate cytidylyltransferase [Bryobacterales bacterium]MBV9401599.1 3-deoxy-manno-octulosonate cytidylyltransferase [Bryobacterales bacterium]
MPHRVLGVIPARYASSRFPGKVLATIAGKTMLQHVWERASQARYLTSLAIATDDERIRDAAREFGARVVMTRADHVSGTDRVAEAASSSNAGIVVNIQGDEPMIDPTAIDIAILGLIENDEAPMATLKKRIERPGDVTDPNVVKVVTDASGMAIYFSRSPIPYLRDKQGDESRSPAFPYFKHLGLYAYRRDFLLAYPDLPVGPLERAERLEQLRAIENGFKIHVGETEYDSVGVDTPEDCARVAEIFEKTMVST